ncbi:hypothetical protein D3C87_1636770 [compost metagenome]
MHHLTLPLDLAVNTDHAGRQHHAPVFFEGFHPQHRIGDARLILQRHEDHPLCRAGALAHQHQTRRFQPCAITGAHGLRTGDDTAAGKIAPQECHGMFAQRQSDMAVILNYLTTVSHGPERDGGFLKLIHHGIFPTGGGGEKRQRLIPQGLDGPERLASGKRKRR